MKKVKLQKWGAAWCGPCVAMAKGQVLEKFEARHPEVSIEVHDDTEDGSKAWEKKADALNIKALPTLIWFVGGEELFRSSDVSITGLEKQYAKVLKAAGG